jgi:hypothetical protein
VETQGPLELPQELHGAKEKHNKTCAHHTTNATVQTCAQRNTARRHTVKHAHTHTLPYMHHTTARATPRGHMEEREPSACASRSVPARGSPAAASGCHQGRDSPSSPPPSAKKGDRKQATTKRGAPTNPQHPAHCDMPCDTHTSPPPPPTHTHGRTHAHSPKVQHTNTHGCSLTQPPDDTAALRHSP